MLCSGIFGDWTSSASSASLYTTRNVFQTVMTMTLPELPLPAPRQLNAQDIAVSGLRVWYHLPFSLSDAALDLAKEGWVEARAEATLQQSFYFHSFVADAIWDKPTGEKTALFDLHRKRRLEGTGFEAQHDSPDMETQTDSATLKRQGLTVGKP